MRFDETYAEMTHVNEFRNSVLYGDKVNSIAEWMLSPEWTTPKDDHGARGFSAGTSWVKHSNSASGEINAATCHCHRSNGDSWSLR